MAESNKNILKLDESCISKIEIRNLKLDQPNRLEQSNFRFRISIFEMQDSSNFKISSAPGLHSSLV